MSVRRLSPHLGVDGAAQFRLFHREIEAHGCPVGAFDVHKWDARRRAVYARFVLDKLFAQTESVFILQVR